MTLIAAAGSPGKFDASMMTRLPGRWLLLAAYGPRARRHMVTAWAALACLATVDALWLQFSHLSFAPSNLDSLVRLVAYMALAFGFCGLIAYRLDGEAHPVGVALREITRRIEFLPCCSRRDGAAKRWRVLGARCLRMRRDYTVAATAGSQVAAKCCCSFGI